ncbi:MAG: ParA family protein [Chloroflexi bacterium]|nr:ParA family protein [Chloroflexota bacterium]
MGKLTAIVNQKGGVGKTTTAVNLAACLTEMNKKILLIDIDPQGNTTSGLGIDKRKVTRCIYNVLIDDLPAVQAIVPTPIPGLHLIPATPQLAGAEIELVPQISREHKLRNAIANIKDKYEYLLVDCPPSLGLLTINALTASDSVLIPIQCEYYALEGLGQLINTYQLVRKHLNPKLEIEGVLLTMFDARTNLSIQVVDEVKKHFGSKVYRSIIPRNVRLSEAPSHGKPVTRYDPKSKGAEVYFQLAREVIGLE